MNYIIYKYVVEAFIEKQCRRHAETSVHEWQVEEAPVIGPAEGGVARVFRAGRCAMDLREGDTRGAHGLHIQSETEEAQDRPEH